MKNKNNCFLRYPIVVMLMGLLLLSGLPLSAMAGPITVKGVITDVADGSPMPGVTVQVEKTKKGTVTNGNGEFSIEAPESNSVLLVSFIGYATKRVELNGQTQLAIKLETDIKNIDEIVVVGYGTMRKGDVTGSVTSVKSDDLKKNVSNTLDQALQGRAAGVTVVNNSGQPGTSVSIRVRGSNSLQGTNEPLYVIDGVQVAGAAVSNIGFSWAGGGYTGTTATSSPLANINPSDIESLEILKDASACAIYGSRGANGVILITTKRGKKNEMKVSFEHTQGVKSLAKGLDVMNATEYAAYQNEMYKANSREPRKDLANLTGVNTDWQKEIFRSGAYSNSQLSLSGGTDKTTYYLGAGYNSDKGDLIGTNFERMSLRLNLENKTREWLTLGTNTNIGRSKSKIPLTETDDGAIMTALQYDPTIKVRNDDGTFGAPSADQNQNGAFGASSVNPIAFATTRQLSLKTTDISSNIFADLHYGDFSFRNEVSASLGYNNNYGFYPTYEYSSIIKNSLNKAYYRSSNNYYTEVKSVLNYNKKFLEDHSINVMLGHEARSNRYEYTEAIRSNFKNNDVHQLIAGDASTATNNGDAYKEAAESYFGRLFYNYNDLLMLTGSYRYDGSSKFEQNARWGKFPSVSTALRVSNFAFFKDNISTVNNLKFTVSYGESGNSQISDNLYLASLNPASTALGSSYVFNVPINDLTWETTKSSNAGVEIGLFSNRIQIQADVYKKKSTNALTDLLLPGYLGSNTIPQIKMNAGSIENKGIELTLSTVNIEGDFRWTSDFTYAKNVNQVLSLGEGGIPVTSNFPLTNNIITYTDKGDPIGSFYGYKVAGVYQNAEDIASLPRNKDLQKISPDGLWLGDLYYEDIDKTSTADWELKGYTGQVENGKLVKGTLKYTGNDADMVSMKGVSVIDDKDRTYLGSPIPKFTFSINNTFAYKNFDMTIFLNGSYGNKIFNANRMILEGMNYLDRNQLNTVTSRAIPVLNANGNANNPFDYTLTNANSGMPRAKLGDQGQNIRISSRYIEDGSYLRIQNVVLGYTLPTNLVKRFNISSLRVFGNVQNLYTFTKYKGFDPEVGVSGIDLGHYPMPRTISLGLQLSL